MKNIDVILDKINSNSAVIGIVGLGYVGLPLLFRFTESGYKVIGFDIDSKKVEMLNAGKSYIKHIKEEQVKSRRELNLFEATTDFSKISEVDAIILCVPTPLTKNREPDMSFIVDTINKIQPYLRENQILSLESTTYPGTTEEIIRPRIEERDFKIGENYFLVYSPEREDPGNPVYSTKDIPKVVGGSTQSCKEVGIALYESIINKVIPVSCTQAAEFVKLLENIYRSVNIGLVNEMKMITDKMGLNIWEIISAASTKPFGFKAFYPGPGLGGHCIPIDPFYLTWKARQYEVNTKFIELSGEVNTSMPEWVVGKVMDALNDQSKSLKGSKVIVLGLAYKKNVDDPRESPSIKLLELLQAKGAEIAFSDPYIPVFPRMREHYFDLKSTPLTEETLSSADCILISTDHDDFDYDLIQKHSKLIVDTRGRYQQRFDNVVMS